MYGIDRSCKIGRGIVQKNHHFYLFRAFLVDIARNITNPPRPTTKLLTNNQDHSSMRGVTMKKGEPVDRALKRLKTKLDAEGILEEIRRRRSFETPTDRFKRKLRTASKRNKLRWRYSNDKPTLILDEPAE
jgi:small subunit ribosomal protein S21